VPSVRELVMLAVMKAFSCSDSIGVKIDPSGHVASVNSTAVVMSL